MEDLTLIVRKVKRNNEVKLDLANKNLSLIPTGRKCKFTIKMYMD